MGVGSYMGLPEDGGVRYVQASGCVRGGHRYRPL